MKLSPFFGDVITIDDSYLLIEMSCKVGIKSANDIMGWILSPIYDTVTLPIDGHIVGIKSNKESNTCVVYRISETLVEIASFDVDIDLSVDECLFSLRKLINASDLPLETKQWADKSDELVVFPLEEHYIDSGDDSYNTYSSYDSLMDALDGEPDAYWNID